MGNGSSGVTPSRTLALDVDSADRPTGVGERAQAQIHLSAGDFAAKWRQATTTENAGSQEHFIDVCRMLSQPTPHDADPTGESYAFEKRVSKAGGGDGFADVWKRDFFACWEHVSAANDLVAREGPSRTIAALYNRT